MAATSLDDVGAGVAERTGATNYYVELFPRSAAQAKGRAPVLGLTPVPGDVDIVIASEPMEAGRAVQRGLVTPDRTTFIVSTNRVYAMTEKIALPTAASIPTRCSKAAGSRRSGLLPAIWHRLAKSTGSVISAVLFGALAGAQACRCSAWRSRPRSGAAASA